jgi:hypothetical protein
MGRPLDAFPLDALNPVMKNIVLTSHVSLRAVGLSMVLLTACTSESISTSVETSGNGNIRAPTVGKHPAGEVPEELFDSIIENVIESEGIELEDITVDRAESVIWPDGSLGCPRPGEMYTQAPVNGYWVVLKAGERRYDYRASVKGEIRRCDVSNRLQLPVG